jgi:hypothetical protein
MLGDRHGNLLREAARVLEGFDSIFGGESSHQQRQLRVGCHMNWHWINALHIFGGAITAMVYFHNKFDVFRFVCPFSNGNRTLICYFEIVYTTAGIGLPHSKQRAVELDVINPQDGHILCDRSPVN